VRGTKLMPDRLPASAGRLTSRPVQVKDDQLQKPALSGLLPLKLERERDGYIYVPSTYSAGHPAPLILLLHGAGGDARQSIPLLQHLADRSGMILLAPDSRQPTWDVIVDGYGPDVAFIDRALDQTFSRFAIDPAHIGIGGFSDGASYALSLGITNGDLFTHVLAFSPGFMAPAGQHGAPALFLSHGTQDRVLPIDFCSRKLFPRLEHAGYRVDYREFEGPHTVPPDIARAAVDWFLKGGT
jgi:phospholipase/carboxylesterase